MGRYGGLPGTKLDQNAWPAMMVPDLVIQWGSEDEKGRCAESQRAVPNAGHGMLKAEEKETGRFGSPVLGAADGSVNSSV